MPRIPSPRTTQERRWRFLRVTRLAGFTAAKPLPVSSAYQQLQGSYNGVEGNGGNTSASAPHLNPSHGQQATLSPSRNVIQSVQYLIAKPRNVSNSRLQPLLIWESEQYAAIQAFIHEQARNDLDVSLPLKKQAESKLVELRDKCSQRFSVLQSYQDDWVTLEFVRRFLKNSSSRS